MPKKGQFLERHGNQWRVIVKVSAKARPILGKAHLKRPLHTDSLPRAEAMKWDIIAELKAIVAEAERQADTKVLGGLTAVHAEALQWRTQLQRSKPVSVLIDDDEALVNPVAEVLDDRAEEIEREHGYETAKAFADIAQVNRAEFAGGPNS